MRAVDTTIETSSRSHPQDRRRRHRRRRPRRPVLRAEARAASGHPGVRRAARRGRLHAPGRRAASPRRWPRRHAEAHAADTVAAGAGIVDEAIALGLAREAPARIQDLLRYGVPFDRDLEGKLAVAAKPRIRRAASCMCAATWRARRSWRRSPTRCARRRRSACSKAMSPRSCSPTTARVTGMQLRRSATMRPRGP